MDAEVQVEEVEIAIHDSGMGMGEDDLRNLRAFGRKGAEGNHGPFSEPLPCLRFFFGRPGG